MPAPPLTLGLREPALKSLSARSQDARHAFDAPLKLIQCPKNRGKVNHAKINSNTICYGSRILCTFMARSAAISLHSLLQQKPSSLSPLYFAGTRTGSTVIIVIARLRPGTREKILKAAKRFVDKKVATIALSVGVATERRLRSPQSGIGEPSKSGLIA
jgi:hypothetical protein